MRSSRQSRVRSSREAEIPHPRRWLPGTSTTSAARTAASSSGAWTSVGSATSTPGARSEASRLIDYVGRSCGVGALGPSNQDSWVPAPIHQVRS